MISNIKERNENGESVKNKCLKVHAFNVSLKKVNDFFSMLLINKVLSKPLVAF